jgi:hypothetical protein
MIPPKTNTSSADVVLASMAGRLAAGLQKVPSHLIKEVDFSGAFDPPSSRGTPSDGDSTILFSNPVNWDLGGGLRAPHTAMYDRRRMALADTIDVSTRRSTPSTRSPNENWVDEDI